MSFVYMSENQLFSWIQDRCCYKGIAAFRVSNCSFLRLLMPYFILANIISISRGDSMIVTVTGGQIKISGMC